MKTTIVKLCDIFKSDFLGSRHNGERIRNRMDRLFSKRNIVVLDFDNVRTITQAFGDEVIGIFVRAKGLDFVKENIRVVNADAEIRTVLNLVVKYSKRIHDHGDNPTMPRVAPNTP